MMHKMEEYFIEHSRKTRACSELQQTILGEDYLYGGRLMVTPQNNLIKETKENGAGKKYDPRCPWWSRISRSFFPARGNASMSAMHDPSDPSDHIRFKVNTGYP